MITLDHKTHLYTLDGINIPSLSEILKAAGISNYDGVPDSVLERKKIIGRAVHYACELSDKSTLDDSSVKPLIRPYLDAWVDFVKKEDVEFKYIEESIASRKLWFATTPDRIGRFRDKPTDFEIKTTATILPSAEIQTMAHIIAYNETYPKDRITDRLVVQLKPDGTYKPHYCTDKTDRATFLAALTMYSWQIRKGGYK